MIHSFDRDGMSDENREHHAHRDDFDESALRHLLHDAVRDIEPQPHALHRLRQAVPARRARHRKAMMGAAAGVLLVGVAVPVMVHAAAGGVKGHTNTAGAAASRTVGIGRGGQGGNELGGDSGASAGALGTGSSTGGSTGPGTAGGPPSARASGSSADAGSALTGTIAAAAPLCVRAQLGRGSAQAGVPDSAGRVYGSFTVLNTSNISCTVGDGGQLTVNGNGGTDASKIPVVDHTTGDPATGLPTPATQPLVLGPGKGYKVEFAWIPVTGGGPTGCSTSSSGGTSSSGTSSSGASSSGTSSSGASGSSGSGGTTTAGGGRTGANTTGGTSPTTPSGDAGSSSANAPSDVGTPSSAPATGDGITLSDVPQQGGPAVAATTVDGACAGTVYRTAPMAATR